ncbi:hypothetical protein F2P56_012931 [Juglans regia]|uniref:Retrotransposon Copia-like N-terminal domain-containing protein n=1 Tax=Juglans regia TaxID=51240 RepID=A0A833XPM9_JUGRE|nr:hypothetical protein F2P56_012931 [Juglans regia]
MPSSPNTTLPTFNPSSSINLTKLTHTNFPTWKATILPYLKGQQVFGYIDGTLPKPAKTISASDGSTIPNPVYVFWETQDNLILSCINSSLSEEVLAQVAHCNTSADVWTALISAFASQSRAKAIHVRSQLSTLRKGNQSATDYFMTIKRLTDELAIAGQPLPSDDIVTYLLAGLGPEYDSLVSLVSHRADSLTLEDLYSMLLTFEARIQHNNQILSLPTTSANVATKQQSSGGRGRGHFYPSRGRGRAQYHGTRGGGRSTNTLWCQLCAKLGHTASQCYKRFDPHFQTPPPRPNPQANLTSNHSQQLSHEQEWHPDTGATHHLTSNMNNLNIRTDEFSGNDYVQIGDGTG